MKQASEDAVVRVEGLSKAYRSTAPGTSGEVLALDNVSLEVRRHEFVTIVGPSGCGKSTLLRIIAGIVEATSGACVLTHPDVARKPRVGMAFQSPVLMPWRSVLRNVLLPIELMGLRRADYETRARGLVELAGLEGFEGHYPWQLSGGMQHRCALVRSLVTDPDVLLMDEPFAALDILTREQLASELARIWEATQTTVVFVTHSIEEAVFLADRIIVLSSRPGRVVRQVDVRMPRPRQWDMLAEPEVARLVSEIRNELMGQHGITEEGAA